MWDVRQLNVYCCVWNSVFSFLVCCLWAAAWKKNKNPRSQLAEQVLNGRRAHNGSSSFFSNSLEHFLFQSHCWRTLHYAQSKWICREERRWQTLRFYKWRDQKEWHLHFSHIVISVQSLKQLYYSTMEDVCDLSHLLQSEHHEKEKLEKSLSEIDSTLEIETRRFKCVPPVASWFLF